MDRARYAGLFLSESREHLSQVNRLLLELESEGFDAARVEELFRSVHTLKGMAGAMGFARAAELAHAVEQLLDPLRAGTLALDAEIVDALFQGADALEGTLRAEAVGEGGPALAPLVDRLHALGEVEPAAPDAAPISPLEADGGVGSAAAEAPCRVTVLVAPTAPLPAVRAVLALRRARELGAVSEVEPPEQQLLAGDFGGTLSFTLRAELEEDEVRAALLAVGEIARVEVEAEGAAEAGAETAGGAGGGEAALVRVAQRELDTLLDQVGEMVVARDQLRRLAERRDDPELDAVADHLARLIGEQRDEVLRMRMAPAAEVFDRFPRLVRDAARELGRRVSLTLQGGEVRLDRALLKEVGDLLVHLLRNAVDHGIEPPEERVAAGKPEQGRLRVRAEREHSRFVVVVEDDGRGIASARVRQEAAARGWMGEDGSLSEAEMLEVITRPGFSTAERVTSLSGRGVGLDVVRSRVRALGGTLSVASEPGRGTTFTVRLPLTLAITRALLAEVDGATYIVPVAGVAEVTEVAPHMLGVDGAARRFALRDETLPLLDLRALLGRGEPRSITGWTPVLVLTDGDLRVGVLVDALRGQVEAVVKPFDAPLELVPVFAGATVRADGSAALILDVPRVIACAVDGSQEPRAAGTTPTTESLC